MKVILQYAIFVLGLLWLASGHSMAEKRVALVIGNAAYQNVAELKNPKNDALAMSRKLKSLGFEVVEGIDLDLAAMRKTIREFVIKLSGADLRLFYYAGHGLQVDGRNYMAPIDAKLENYFDLNFETLPVQLVLSAMEQSAKTNLVFLDACRNNPLARNLARSMGTRSASVGRGLARIGSGIGTFVSFSTQPGNVALDGNAANSPYTAALVRHLGTPGEDISRNMISVRREVIKTTNGKQVPWEHSSLTGNVILKSAPASVRISGSGKETTLKSGDPAISSQGGSFEITFWNSIKDGNDPNLFEAYLKQFPNGVFSDLASLKVTAAGKGQNLATNSKSKNNSAEIAFWNTIKSSANQDYFQLYIKQYPDGLYRPLAELMALELERQIKVGDPEKTIIANLDARRELKAENIATEEVTRDTVRNIQRQLNRLGCSAGKADGLWGKRSRRALTQYRRHAKVDLVSLEPTGLILRQLTAKSARICPLTCRSGYRINKGRCVRIRQQAKIQEAPPPQPDVVEPAPKPKNTSLLSILTGSNKSKDPIKSILLPILAPKNNGNKVCFGCKKTQ